MIVEDEAIIALDLEMQVEDLGHVSVGQAGTTESAIDLARRMGPDLALVDLRLADGDDGRDVAMTLRAELGIPSVLLSGSLSALDAADLSEIRPLGTIAKPVQSGMLGRVLNRLGDLATAAA